MGLKSPDWWGVYGYSACHDAIDRRTPGIAWDHADLLRALHETQKLMIAQGLISIKGAA